MAMEFGGKIDYITALARAYPFRDVETYSNALQTIKEIREESKKKLDYWINEGLIEPRILEKTIEQNKTDDIVEAYENIRHLPYDVSWYLDSNKIERGKLTEYFAKLFNFCDVAEDFIERRIKLRKAIEENKDEATKLGIKWEK